MTTNTIVNTLLINEDVYPSIYSRRVEYFGRLMNALSNSDDKSESLNILRELENVIKEITELR